jgi:transcriptional regulator with XRE-family HTH domain
MSPGEIKRIRSDLGLNQKEFGQLLDVSRPTVQRWETGKTSPGQMKVNIMRQLHKKAKEKGRSMDWIETLLFLAGAGAFGVLLGKIFDDMNSDDEVDPDA